MKEKKNLILEKCRDLIYKEAFKRDYDTVKRLYTDSTIQIKLDNYLNELIERGELFYGDNFVEDFVNERTDDARLWLIRDLKSNGIDDKIVKNDYSILDAKKTYENLINELVKKNNLSLDKANNIIRISNKNPEVRKIAEDYFRKKEETSIDLENSGVKEETSDDLEMSGEVENQSQDKDFSGLDKTAPEFENLNEEQLANEDELTDEEEPIKIQTEEPKPGLLKKFKEKWKDPNFRKKVIIGGTIIAIGTVAVALNPEFQSFVSHFLSNFDFNQVDSNTVSHATSSLNNLANEVSYSMDKDALTAASKLSQVAESVMTAATSASTLLDTSSWNMEGLQVAQTAYDAAFGNTNFIASEFFSNNIQGFFDVSTNQMLNVSPEDLQNADFVRDVLQDDNIAVVFGNGEINSLDNVSGFVNGDDVINLMDHGRSR